VKESVTPIDIHLNFKMRNNDWHDRHQSVQNVNW